MTIKQLLIILITLSLILGTYYFYKNGSLNFLKKTKETAELVENTTRVNTGQTPTDVQGPVPVINEVPEYKLPSGEQIYNISHGDKATGPKATKIIYNPLSLTPGTPQTITLIFPETEIVSSGVLFITTDNLENQKITLIQDQNKKGFWSATWEPKDTINKRYSVRIYLVGPSGTYNNTMKFL